MTNNIARYIGRQIGESTKFENQKELAEAAGMKREYLNRIINRHVCPTIKTALKISRALNISVERLWEL